MLLIFLTFRAGLCGDVAAVAHHLLKRFYVNYQGLVSTTAVCVAEPDAEKPWTYPKIVSDALHKKGICYEKEVFQAEEESDGQKEF